MQNDSGMLVDKLTPKYLKLSSLVSIPDRIHKIYLHGASTIETGF